MSRPRHELAEVIRLFGKDIVTSGLINAWQKKTLTDLEACRTARLGGHIDACTSCGTLQLSYNSCRNRNCPKCQSLERESWILGREADLLPVVYYHVVFTLPSELNGLCLYNPKFMYDCLFESAWKTLEQFASDPKWLDARSGATMVLHTWGQNLSLHPHVHCIVPGGGLAADGTWQNSRGGGMKFLYPVLAMSKVFRAIFLQELCKYLAQGYLVLPKGEVALWNYASWKRALYKKAWVVYAKRPFGGPKQVIEYLGRYTHKTAISNHRLLDVSEAGVRFSYKDYKAEGTRKEMVLEGTEFLRRFCMHILPKGFRRMRHFGILSNAGKAKALEACRKHLTPQAAPIFRKTKKELREAAKQKLLEGRPSNWCPCCKSATMMRIGEIPRQSRPPPGEIPYWSPTPVENL